MTMIVIAKMELRVNSSDIGFRRELYKRFDQELEFEWSSMAWVEPNATDEMTEAEEDALNRSIVKRLNKVFSKSLLATVKDEFSNYSPPKTADSVTAIALPDAGTWNRGSNGQHEVEETVRVKLAVTGSEEPWMLSSEGAKLPVLVFARWTLVKPLAQEG